MTNKLSLNPNHKLVINAIWLCDIESISAELRETLYNNSFTFKLTLNAYCGDVSHAVIDIDKLGEWLKEQSDAETADESLDSNLVPQLDNLWSIAREHSIDEIYFN